MQKCVNAGIGGGDFPQQAWLKHNLKNIFLFLELHIQLEQPQLATAGLVVSVVLKQRS